MSFCEDYENLFFLLGFARNARLQRAIGRELQEAQELYRQTGHGARVFRELRYRTRSSWSVERRVVAKAEYLAKGANPRFIVTNLEPARWGTQVLYEGLYCARGDMENRIKEQQLYLFADRTSCHAFRANQLRLWLASLAYLFLAELRRVGLRGTEQAHAQGSTIRLKLLKVASSVTVSVRRVLLRFPRSYPYWDLWQWVRANFSTA